MKEKKANGKTGAKAPDKTEKPAFQPPKPPSLPPPPGKPSGGEGGGEAGGQDEEEEVRSTGNPGESAPPENEERPNTPGNQPATLAAAKPPEERVNNPDTLRHIQEQAGRGGGPQPTAARPAARPATPTTTAAAPAGEQTETARAEVQREVRPAGQSTWRASFQGFMQGANTALRQFGMLVLFLLLLILLVLLIARMAPGMFHSPLLANQPPAGHGYVDDRQTPGAQAQSDTHVNDTGSGKRNVPTEYMDEPEAPKVQTCGENIGGMAQNNNNITISGNGNIITSPLVVNENVFNASSPGMTNVSTMVTNIQGEVTGQQYDVASPTVIIDNGDNGGVYISSGTYVAPFGSPIGHRYGYFKGPYGPNGHNWGGNGGGFGRRSGGGGGHNGK